MEPEAPPIKTTTTSSRFRFRDHQEPDDSADTDTGSDLSSVSSYKDDEPELDSMTGKGISRLCTELLEIKAASDEDFHKNIFANYSAFAGIFEDVSDMERELVQLKNQVLTQKRLVKDLIDGAYLKLLSEKGIESMINGSDELLQQNELEDHINDVSESIDILMSENRIDEAIAIIEMEEENLQKVQAEDRVQSDVLLLYNSSIAEKKAMLTLQLTLVAENSRVAAPELQKALVGLCRLGDSHLATQLLIKYYHLRLATGIQSLQKSFIHLVYVRELSKYVFSTISQAAKSFVMLYGETSPYTPELIQWVQEEIEVFVVYFTKYVKSISEISGRLSTAVEAVQFAMSYCSLLESQKLVFRPFLIDCIRPRVEEILQMHIDHFKKVIGIFTATDVWSLGRYLVPGILNESYSSTVVGQQPEYCPLTNSGRKFVTLLQAIHKDVLPLIVLQMEGSILSGLTNLFLEYVSILERAISSEKKEPDRNSLRIIYAESVTQQASILVNLSTLEQFFSSMVISTFTGINCGNSGSTNPHSCSIQQQDLDDCAFLIQEACSQLRAHFCQQFVGRIVSVNNGSKPAKEIPIYSGSDPDFVQFVMPSAACQVFFLELRKLGQLAEENVFEMDWLMELVRELFQGIFLWITRNKEIGEVEEDKPTSEHLNSFNQLVLDIHFLVEIAKQGEYFSNNPLVLTTLMNSAFVAAGLDPGRDVEDEGWAIEAATEAIERLLEIEKIEPLSNAASSAEEPLDNFFEHVNEDVPEDERCSSANSEFSDDDPVATDLSEVSINRDKQLPSMDLSPSTPFLDVPEEKASLDRSASHMKGIAGDTDDRIRKSNLQ